MEDFLKFLLVAGVVLVGIFKEVSRNNRSKKVQNKRPAPPAPPPVEVNPDAIPIPEFWGGGGRALDELLRPISMKRPTPRSTPKKKEKEEVSVTASITNSSAQDKRNAKQGPRYNHLEPTGEGDFSIHFIEEARRTIIQGEILQRKY